MEDVVSGLNILTVAGSFNQRQYTEVNVQYIHSSYIYYKDIRWLKITRFAVVDRLAVWIVMPPLHDSRNNAVQKRNQDVTLRETNAFEGLENATSSLYHPISLFSTSHD